jgi:sulfite exporter TauE/SafE
MSAAIPWPILGAALATGLAGSAHCFVMCGGMAGALGVRARSTAATPLGASFQATLYQIGRVSGYSMTGALVGTFSGAQWFMQLASAAVLLRVAAGALTLLIAVRMLSGRNLLAALERAGAHLWRRLQPLTHRAARNTTWYASFLLGLLWGWLPCGMVYSVLLLSATAGGAAAGAATMASFGIGTLPAMLGSSLLVSQVPGAFRGPALRVMCGVLLALFGAWMLVQPLMLSEHAH